MRGGSESCPLFFWSTPAGIDDATDARSCARPDAEQRGMSRLSALQIVFLVVNAAIGLAVATAAARSPQFAALPIPTFAWLVLGMLAFEVLTGLALKTHPAAAVSMPLRMAGLIVSFVVCYLTLAMLKAE
jgi:hypothetical protein